MLTIVAFACLGFLIGSLIGLSVESTLAVLIPLLFTFAGGSAIAFFTKMETASRRITSAAVIALSLASLIGVYSGIYISEHQLLSPAGVREERLHHGASRQEMGYLRAQDISNINAINQQYRTGDLTAQQAYERLYELISREDKP